MNVFVLNTGRCGSTTFHKACRHITNFTTGHESRSRFVGEDRFRYPPNHIEADNRLSWVLGRLHRTYGDGAFYVHLRRDDKATAKSYVKLYHGGIIRAYREGVLKGASESSHPLDVSLDYCDTVNSNIELFLADKSARMDFSLENGKEDFRRFWSLIGAEGDLDAALAEWDVTHNSTAEREAKPVASKGAIARAGKRLRRAVKTSPFVAEPRRWFRQLAAGGVRLGWLGAAFATLAAGVITDLNTSAYNVAIFYPLVAAMFAFAVRTKSWSVAWLLVALTYVGYIHGPWPGSANEDWGRLLLSHRMLNRTLVALAVLATTPLLPALVSRSFAARPSGGARQGPAVLSRDRLVVMVACPLVILAVAAFDVWVPPRVNTTVLFAVPLFLCAWTSSRPFLWAMALFAVAAGVCGFLWDADLLGDSPFTFSPNRLIAMLAIPVIAALLHRWMSDGGESPSRLQPA